MPGFAPVAGYVRALVVPHVDDHARTGDEYLFSTSVAEPPFRVVEDVEPFVNVLPCVATVVGAEYAVVYRADIDGAVPALMATHNALAAITPPPMNEPMINAMSSAFFILCFMLG